MNREGIILIVDDEVPIRRLLAITLGADGYQIVEAASGREALTLAASHRPDVVILDLGLPDMDGMEVLKRLREWYSRPVLILSARNSEEDIIHALDGGANDYLSKPFRTGELAARIRAAIRLDRSGDGDPVIGIGNLTIDLTGHTVKKRGETLHLTSTEFALLALLARNAGRVLTHQYLLKELWGYGSGSYGDQSQNLRVFVTQLRKKIEENPAKPALLITESGIGYRFGT